MNFKKYLLSISIAFVSVFSFGQSIEIDCVKDSILIDYQCAGCDSTFTCFSGLIVNDPKRSKSTYLWSPVKMSSNKGVLTLVGNLGGLRVLDDSTIDGFTDPVSFMTEIKECFAPLSIEEILAAIPPDEDVVPTVTSGDDFTTVTPDLSDPLNPVYEVGLDTSLICDKIRNTVSDSLSTIVLFASVQTTYNTNADGDTISYTTNYLDSNGGIIDSDTQDYVGGSGQDNGNFQIDPTQTILSNGDTLVTYTHTHTTSSDTDQVFTTKTICPVVLTGTVEGELFTGSCENIIGNIKTQETCSDGSTPTFELASNVDTGFVDLNLDGSFLWHPPSDLEDCPNTEQVFTSNVFCGDDLIGTVNDTILIVEPPQALSFGILDSESTDLANGTGDFNTSFEFNDSDGVPLDQTCSDFTSSCFEVRLTIPTVNVPLTAEICNGQTTFTNQSTDWITYIDPIIQNIVWSGNTVTFDTEKRDGALSITNAGIGDIAGTGQPRTDNHDGTTSQGVIWCYEMRLTASTCNGESNWAKSRLSIKPEYGTWYLSTSTTSSATGHSVQAFQTRIDATFNNTAIYGSDVINWNITAEGSVNGGLVNTPYASTGLGNNNNALRVGVSAQEMRNYIDDNFSDEYIRVGHEGQVPYDGVNNTTLTYSLENDVRFGSQFTLYADVNDVHEASLISREGINTASANFPPDENTFNTRHQNGLAGVQRGLRFGELTNPVYTTTGGQTFTPMPVLANPTGSNVTDIIHTHTPPGIYRRYYQVDDNGIAPAPFNNSFGFIDHHVLTF